MKNLKVDSSRICIKEANFHIATGKSDNFEFSDSHLVKNVEFADHSSTVVS